MGSVSRFGLLVENTWKRNFVVDPIECRAVSILSDSDYLPPVIARVDMSTPEWTYATYSGVIGTKTEESCLTPTQLACFQETSEGSMIYVYDL
jgi:hypothetical protein